MAFFLVSLNSGSDFRLRHLSEVKISRTTLSTLIFGLAPEQKISLGILGSHERMAYIGEWVRTQYALSSLELVHFDN